MTFADHFRPRWRHSDTDVRMREVQPIHDRSTLEQILEQRNAPTDVRRVAAERLFADSHIRSHARLSVREAAAQVLEDRALLRVIADHDSEAAVRVVALSRLGDASAIQTCPFCGQQSLASEVLCRCGFDLVNGDLAAAREAFEHVRRQGRPAIVAGLILIGLGLAGGMELFPIRISIFLHIGSHTIDLLFVGAGCTLVARGRRMRAGPPRISG